MLKTLACNTMAELAKLCYLLDDKMPNNPRKPEKTTASITISCTQQEKDIVEEARRITEISRKEGKLSLSDFLRDMIIIKCKIKVAKFNEEQELKRKNRKKPATDWTEIK